MRCEKIMKKDVMCVSPDDSAEQAALIMREQNVGFLPVCDRDGCVLGALTDRDLATRMCADGGDPVETLVGDIMTREVVACRPEDDITLVEQLMSTNRKMRIMVTDAAGQLLGVVTLTDVAERDSNKHTARTLRKIVGREYRF